MFRVSLVVLLLFLCVSVGVSDVTAQQPLFIAYVDAANASTSLARVDGGANGFEYSPGGIFGQSIRTMTIHNGNLFVGGRLLSLDPPSSDLSIDSMLSFDGNAWTRPGGVGGGDVRSIAAVNMEAIDPDASRVVVGGDFQFIDDMECPRIGMFHGGMWMTFGEGLSRISNGVNVASVSSVAVGPWGWTFVGGDFNQAGTLSASNIAYWNGTIWFAMAPGSTNPVTAMSFEGNFLYVADGPILRSWNVNTKTWSTIATFAKTGGNAKINSIVVSSGGSRVYVGGDFTSVGGSSYNNLAVYDTGSSSWSALAGSGANGPVNSLVLSSLSLYIGGSFTSIGGVAANNVARMVLASGTVSAIGPGVDGEVTSLAYGALTVSRFTDAPSGPFGPRSAAIRHSSSFFLAAFVGLFSVLLVYIFF